MEAWIEGHGHRAPDEFDLATPRWRERRKELIEMAGRLHGGADPRERHVEHVSKVSKEVDEVVAKLGPSEREELEERMTLCRSYLRFREDGKYYLMMGYDLLREVALEAGSAWRSGGMSSS